MNVSACSAHCTRNSLTTNANMSAGSNECSIGRHAKSIGSSHPTTSSSAGNIVTKARPQPERATLVYLMHDILNGASYDWISELTPDVATRLATYAQASWFDVIGYTFFYTPTYEVTTIGGQDAQSLKQERRRQGGDSAWIVHITTYEVLGHNNSGPPFTFKSNPIPFSTIKKMRDKFVTDDPSQSQGAPRTNTGKPEIHEILIGKVLEQVAKQAIA